MERLGLIERLGLDPSRVASFLKALEHEYVTMNPGNYHCAALAADVTQATAFILAKGQCLERGLLTEVQAAALVLAAAGHDVAHPGLTNSARAARAKDSDAPIDADAEFSEYRTGGVRTLQTTSINEEMHARITMQLMSQSSQHSPWVGDNLKISAADIDEAQAVVWQSILFTDMARQGELLRRFNQAVDAHKLLTEGGGGDHRGEMLPPQDSHILAALILHVADISNTARPGPVFLKWADLLRTELRCMMDVSMTDSEQAAGQASFGEGPVKTAFETLHRVLREPLDEMLTQLKVNSEEWRRLEKDAN
jgi:hypothetical protein